MEYKAILIQAGEGCDHTIGCGQNLINVPGENSNEAMKNLKEHILENYTDERSLESAILLLVKRTVTLDVNWLYNEADKEKVKSKDQDELEEYERLHKKFGPK